MAACRSALRCSNILRSCLNQGVARSSTKQGLLSCLQTSNLTSARSLSSALSKAGLATKCFKKTSLNAPICNVHSSITASSLLMGDNVLNQTHAGVQEQELEDDEEQNHRRRKVEPMYDKDVIDKVQLEMKKSQLSGKIFAVVHIGGRQFKITINDVIVIDRIDAETGDRLRLEKVLLVGGENYTLIGRPLLERKIVRVEATVFEKTKSDPVQVFKKKRRKNYQRWKEHQQDMTLLRINKIDVKPSLLRTL